MEAIETTRADYAVKYAALGFYLLPIHWIENGKCSCGSQLCKSPGKHPIQKLAPRGLHSASNDPETLKRWFTAFPKANMGVSLEHSNLCAVDIDPRNGGDVTQELLEAEHGPFESNWTQKTGGSGLHFLYLTKKGLALPGKLGPGIDLKYRGYVLLDPSRTEGPYEFIDGGPLDGDEPSPLPAWIEALAIKVDESSQSTSRPVEPGACIGFEWMGDDGFEELKDALSWIPNWDREDWLKVGMAIHMMANNQAGEELWEWWSRLDRGDQKFNAKDQARVWRSFTRKKDISIHRESIFFWAAEQGWRSKADVLIEKQVDRIIDSVENGPEVETKNYQQEFNLRCPVPMLEETAAWLSAHGGAHYQTASIAGAISIASLAASRVYIGTEGSMPHLYLGVSSRSLNEIRYVSSGIETILIESGLRRLTRSIRFSGPSSLYKCLFRSPATLYITGEWETLLRFARRQPSGVTEQVLNLLADIYSRRDMQIDSAEEFGLTKIASDEQPVIRNPALGILAILSMDAWELLSKNSEIGRGATELMFTVVCDSQHLRESPAKHEPTPAWLIEHIRKVRNLPAKGPTELDTDLVAIFGNASAEMRPELKNVDFDTHPSHYDFKLTSLTTRRDFLPLINGARRTMRRMAVSLAAWNDPDHPIVTKPIMEWCAAFVAHHLGVMLERIEIMDNEGQVSIAQKVLLKVMEAGELGITQRELYLFVRPFKNLGSDGQAKLLDQMELDGDIRIGHTNRGGKKGGKRIFYSKFVTEEQSNAA